MRRIAKSIIDPPVQHWWDSMTVLSIKYSVEHLLLYCFCKMAFELSLMLSVINEHQMEDETDRPHPSVGVSSEINEAELRKFSHPLVLVD